MKWLCALAFALPLLAAAGKWTGPQKEALIASELMLAADWAQTRQIARNPALFRELNPILGEHPSVGRVNTYFLAAMTLNYLFADWLGDNREFYLGAIAVSEGVVVNRNASLGLKVRF